MGIEYDRSVLLVLKEINISINCTSNISWHRILGQLPEKISHRFYSCQRVLDSLLRFGPAFPVHFHENVANRASAAPVRLVPSRFVPSSFAGTRNCAACRLSRKSIRSLSLHLHMHPYPTRVLLRLACRDREKQSTFRQPDAYQ